MEMKGITCKIPLELHNRISDEIRESESTMGKFIEMVINEHYSKEAKSMTKKRMDLTGVGCTTFFGGYPAGAVRCSH